MPSDQKPHNPSKLAPARWRLIISPPAPGPWNMAADEAILEAARKGQVPPTLRLYAWEPACLSLGYAQDFSDVDADALQARGWEIVRRPTGGRAILHTDELTYSVSGPDHEPRLSGGILNSYQRLSSAILAALESLDLAVTAEPKKPAGPGSTSEPVCFEIPSTYEITIGGKKLVGSAQARKKDGVLQHGTLPLSGDLTRITQVLSFDSEAARTRAAARLRERAATVQDALGKSVSWEQAADAFTDAFAATLNLTLVPGEMTPPEYARARELEETKYHSMEWIRNQ